MEVASHPGSIVLARRWVTPRAAEANFHADLLWKELSRRVFKESSGAEAFARLRALAEMGLGEAWWFAGLLLSESYHLVHRATQQLDFLDRAREHWPALLSVGRRYSPLTDLETVPTLVGFCLARQGAPKTNPPFPPLTVERLNELLDNLAGYEVRRLAKGSPTDVAPLLRGYAEIPLLSLAEHLVVAGHDALACEIVRAQNLPDPHGIVRNWLAGAGDPERTVS